MVSDLMAVAVEGPNAAAPELVPAAALDVPVLASRSPAAIGANAAETVPPVVVIVMPVAPMMLPQLRFALVPLDCKNCPDVPGPNPVQDPAAR